MIERGITSTNGNQENRIKAHEADQQATTKTTANSATDQHRKSATRRFFFSRAVSSIEAPSANWLDNRRYTGNNELLTNIYPNNRA